MEDLFNRLVLGVALQQFYAFTLVVIRMAGLMTIGPVFGQPVVPANVRIFLVLALAVLITPTLHDQSQTGFKRLDGNSDGLLIRDEMPEPLQPHFDRLLDRAGRHDDEALTAAEFHDTVAASEVPSTILDYAWIGVGEFALGLVLGLGVLTIFSGLQLAGELIDQQTGFAMGEIANPGLQIDGSMTGQFLFLLGVTLFLILEPISGHLMIVAALVETFQVLPVGEASITSGTVDLLRDLVHQSLVLGVQVAAPLLATMSLVALTMGFLGHTVPQLNVLVIGFPIRVMVSLLVLALTLSGAARAFVDLVPETIDALRASLTGL